MKISVRMTIHFILNGFSSWTFMYEWLSIFFLNGFMSFKFLYEWLSISLCMGLCHAHFFINDYPYSYGFSSWPILYKWLSIFFLNGFMTFTFLYEWLSISLCMVLPHAHFYTNDYPCSFWVFCQVQASLKPWNYGNLRVYPGLILLLSLK